MKHPKEYYNNISIYEDRDSYVTGWSSKIVKTRLTHECYFCNSEIPKDSYALLEKCFDPDAGPCSSYTCISCVDQYT